jgi:hypothetical protein
MEPNQHQRIVLPDGRICLSSGKSQFVFERLRPGALRVTFSGDDIGQFGSAALDELRMDLLRHTPLELFIDAADALTVSVELTNEWTRFFAASRAQLTRVSVLTGSKFFHLSVAISQHLSQTGNLIQIYTDRALFEDYVGRAT